MNIEKLKKLETSKEIIDKYVASAAFGKNRIVYLPLVIGIGLLFFVAYVIFDNLIATVGTTPLIVMGIICLICFILVKLISSNAAKNLSATTTFAPIGLAKKISGNDNEGVYFCIYTTEEKRHDPEFIDKIAEKINAIASGTQNKSEREVLNLFRPDFVKPNEFGKTLPLDFTENVTVWRKQFSHSALAKEIKNTIENDGDKFVIIGINPENARFLHEYYNN